MQYRLVRRLDHITAEFSGKVALQPFLDVIEQLGEITRAEGDHLLLLNLQGLAGEIHVTGQMQLGKAVARHLAHLSRVASLVPPEKLTRTSEQVAQAQGMALRIFDDRAQALAWLRSSEPPSPADRGPDKALSPPQAAIWAAFRHLFPAHAQAIQLPNGTLAISWSVAHQPGATFEMATPITVRLEPGLLEQMRLATAEQRSRIAAQQEAAFRAGLVGYDPYTSVPRARVIVLG